MRKNKGRSNNKEVHKMENNMTVNNFSLTEFIKANKAKINSITHTIQQSKKTMNGEMKIFGMIYVERRLGNESVGSVVC
jgi:hypothetical protein